MDTRTGQVLEQRLCSEDPAPSAQFVGLMPDSVQPRGGAAVDDAVSLSLSGLVHGALAERREELTLAIGQLRPSWTWADDMIAAALTTAG